MDTINTSTQLSSVNVTASSELMKNHQGALPVTPDDELAAVSDIDGNPMIFSLNPTGDFNIIQHAPDSPTGWTQTDLQSAFKTTGTPRTFIASQITNGSILLIFAIKDTQRPKTENLVIAGPFSNDPSKTDWTKLSDYMNPAKNPNAGTTIEKLIASPVDDGQGIDTPYIALTLKNSQTGKEENHILKSDFQNNKLTWTWKAFPTPNSLRTMIDFRLGTIQGLGQGVYTLFEGNANQIFLTFKSFPVGNHGPYNRVFYAPAGATTIESSPGQNGTTSLYAGGTTGLHWFPPTGQLANAKGIPIASATQIPGIADNGLIANEDTNTGGISLWALNGTDLHYLYNSSGNSGAPWSTPIVFEKSVVKLAPLRNAPKATNQLVYIGANLAQKHELHYFQQDPVTTLWKKDHIPLSDTAKIIEYNSYTSHVNFSDKYGRALISQSLDVYCTSLQRVIINGTTYLIDSNTAAKVKTDTMGNITIINKVDTLACPKFTITSSLVKGGWTVDPTDKVYTNLKTNSSKLPAHKLPAGITATEVSGAVKGLLKFKPPHVGNAALTYAEFGQSTPEMPYIGTMPDGAVFGFSFDKKCARYYEGEAAEGLISDALLGSSFFDQAGDLLRYLENAVDQVDRFLIKVVSGELNFIASLGSEVVQFVVKSFDAMYAALSWIFKKIELAFEDLIHWLGAELGWADIWETHKVIASMVTGGLNFNVNFINNQLTNLETDIKTMFKNIENDLKNSLFPPSQSGNNPIVAGHQYQARHSEINMHSPTHNYANYHIEHGGVINTGSSTAQANFFTTLQSNPFQQFLQNVVIPALDTISTDLDKDLKDIVKIFESDAVTFDDIKKLLLDLINLLLDTADTIVVGILKFLQDLFKDFQSALESQTDIPFLTPLYELIMASLGENEPASFINMMSLIIAIPYTLLFKVANKQHAAPFSGGKTLGLDNPATVEAFLTNLYNNNLLIPQNRAPLAFPQSCSEIDDQVQNSPLFTEAQYTQYGSLVASITGGISLIFKANAPEVRNLVYNSAWFCCNTIKIFSSVALPTSSSTAVNVVRFVATTIAASKDLLIPIMYGKKEKAVLVIVVDSLVLGAGAFANIYDQRSWSLLTTIISNGGGITTAAGVLTPKAYGGPVIRRVGLAASGVSCIIIGVISVVSIVNNSSETVSSLNAGG